MMKIDYRLVNAAGFLSLLNCFVYLLPFNILHRSLLPVATPTRQCGNPFLSCLTETKSPVISFINDIRTGRVGERSILDVCLL
jgi:hypothetical protein